MSTPSSNRVKGVKELHVIIEIRRLAEGTRFASGQWAAGWIIVQAETGLRFLCLAV